MRVEVLERTREYDGFFKIDKARLRYERFNSQMSDVVTRFVFERGDSVAVLLWDESRDSVILIEQFRYPVYVRNGQGWMLEVIAGTQDQGRDVLAVAHAELLEEAGYRVSTLEPIATFFPSPGGSSERIHLYLGRVTAADRIEAGGGHPVEHEDIRVVELPFEEAWSKVEQGHIQDAKTLIALQWLRLQRGQS